MHIAILTANQILLFSMQIKTKQIDKIGQLYVADSRKEGPGGGSHCLRGQGDTTSPQCR